MISHLITNARQRKTFWNPIRSRYLNLWIPLAYGPPLMSYREIFSELGHYQVHVWHVSCSLLGLKKIISWGLFWTGHVSSSFYIIRDNAKKKKKKTFLQFSLKWARVSSSSTLKNQTVCWKNAIWVTFLRMPLFSTTLTWLPVKLSGLKRVLQFRIVAALQHQCSSVLKVKVNLTSFPGSSLFFWRENTFSREDPWNEAE